jgi:hypothetical protein
VKSGGMEQDERNLDGLELPGARWVGAAREFLRRVSPPSRCLAAAQSLIAERRPLPVSPLLRERVESTRARVGRPVIGPPPPEQPSEPAEPRESHVELSEARGLDPALRRRIEALLGLELPLMHVHTGRNADRFVRRHDADAVTVRRDMYFRNGAWDPLTPKGLALLAHEATHAAWDVGVRPSFTSGPATAGEVEERAAQASERRVLAKADAPTPIVPRAPAAVMPPGSAARAPAVKTALSSRDLSDTELPPRATELSPDQIRAIKDDVYRTVLDKMRSDFERGA